MADNYFGNLARATLGQGLAMGWGDELEAKLRSLRGPETYEEELAMIQDSYNKFYEENPGTALTSELAGGFLPTVAAMVSTPFSGGTTAPLAAVGTARTAGNLAKIANMAKNSKFLKNPYGRGLAVGAPTGAITGAGTADMDDRGSGTIVGTVLGSTLGVIIPGGIRTVKGTYNFLKERLGNSAQFLDEASFKRLYEAITTNGGTPQDVVDEVVKGAELGVPVTMGTSTGGTRALSEVVVNKGGEAGDELAEILVNQKGNQGSRIVKRIQDDLGDKNYYDTADELAGNLRFKANKAYQNAYDFGAVDDPRILNLLENNPQFKKAFNNAKKISQTEVDADILAGGDGSKYALTPYKIVDGKAEVLPDVRTLDYLKRGLDEEISRLFRAGKSDQGTALKKLRDSYVDIIDEVTEVDGVSAYKQARKVFAGEIEVINALELGKKDFRKLAPEQLSKKFENFSDAETEAFTLGATRDLLDMITKNATDANFAKKLFGSQDMQKKIQMLFPAAGDESFALFEQAMLREAQLFNQISKITGGSPTARRLGAQEIYDQTGDGIGFVDTVADSMSPSGLIRNVLNMIRSAKVSDEIQSRLAKMLGSSDPEEVAVAVEAIEDYASKSIPKRLQTDLVESTNVLGGATFLTDVNPGETSEPPPDFSEIYPETSEEQNE